MNIDPSTKHVELQGPIFVSPHIIPNLDLNSALACIKPWLSKCLKNHKEGCANIAELPLPRRLLCVTGLIVGEPIFLVETKTIDQSRPIEYATLSHCWGSAQLIQTRSDNYNSHINGINFSTLPKTFQDAILLTNGMNLQYIWIDSLCIIQDDVLDWQQQSALMADIYAGSLLNIAAAHGRDSASGLFNFRSTYTPLHSGISEGNEHERIPFCEDPQGLDTPASAHKLTGSRPIFIRPSLYATHMSYIGGWQDQNPAPLDTRGWVYQERILSPRTISFHASELIWECRKERWCECTMMSDYLSSWKMPKHNPMEVSPGYNMKPVQLQHGCIENHSTIAKSILMSWYGHVRDYCALQLTKEEDRLPAISGIASRTLKLLNNVSTSEGSVIQDNPRYVAGMWGYKLNGSFWVTGYPWYTNRGSCRLRRCKTFLAPTWSWASIVSENLENNSVPWNLYWLQFGSFDIVLYENKDVLFTIEDIRGKVEGDNPFGGTSSATLRVRGKLMLALDVKSFYTEDRVLKQDHPKTYPPIENIEVMKYAERDLDVDDWQPEYAHGKTYGLQIYHRKTKGPEGDIRPFEGGAFILQEIGGENVDAGGDRKFRRIGLVNFMNERDPFRSVGKTTLVTII